MTLCQRCNKAPATVHLTDILPPNGEKRERHLCDRCSREEGVMVQKNESINAILEGFIKQSSGMQEVADTACPNCGLTFREFRAQGLLGCPQDYQVFEKHLSTLIERAHEGGTHHVGKVPSRRGGRPSIHARLAKLRRAMREAVKEEDYELAARLRDELSVLESEKSEDSA